MGLCLLHSFIRSSFKINASLFTYCFTSSSRFFHLYEDVTITVEGLENLGLCSALRAFEQGGVLLCHTWCCTGSRFSAIIWRTIPFSCLLRHVRGSGGPILTKILMGDVFYWCHLFRLDYEYAFSIFHWKNRQGNASVLRWPSLFKIATHLTIITTEISWDRTIPIDARALN
jgi:hypothetical protein